MTRLWLCRTISLLKLYAKVFIGDGISNSDLWKMVKGKKKSLFYSCNISESLKVFQNKNKNDCYDF